MEDCLDHRKGSSHPPARTGYIMDVGIEWMEILEQGCSFQWAESWSEGSKMVVERQQLGDTRGGWIEK